MQRRSSYALMGGLASVGAPVGLLAVRLAQHHAPLSIGSARREFGADRPGYTYISLSTALAFATFGFVLGRQADELASRSVTDVVTGLCNSRGWRERLDAEVTRSRRYKQPLAVLLLDVDRLKLINDRYGHQAGNLAMRIVAGVIRRELRANDVGARWGGDEFGVLAPNTGRPAALALGNRIRRLITTAGAPWPLTVSVGVAAVAGTVEDPADANRLMRQADAALYRAKRAGRNAARA